jgi:hypothetical protein
MNTTFMWIVNLYGYLRVHRGDPFFVEHPPHYVDGYMRVFAVKGYGGVDEKLRLRD